MTCRHFRYEVPREYADELRDADPQPCPVCDVLPHRKALAAKRAATPAIVEPVALQRVPAPSWLTRWLRKREDMFPAIQTPARLSA